MRVKGKKFWVLLVILFSFIIYQNFAVKNTQNEVLIDSIEDNAEKDYEYLIYDSFPEEIIEKINGKSYLKGGPVALSNLRYIQFAYIDFDNRKQVGEMIIHKDLAEEVVEIFRDVYEAKFPIEQIKLIDEYGADDKLSMEANNTSAFCTRPVTGSTNNYSKHSYGIAIDINPVQNPYINGSTVLPSAGVDYLDRENRRKGMIVRGDTLYQAFTKRGWIWGGDWHSLKDYQHFEKRFD